MAEDIRSTYVVTVKCTMIQVSGNQLLDVYAPLSGARLAPQKVPFYPGGSFTIGSGCCNDMACNRI